MEVELRTGDAVPIQPNTTSVIFIYLFFNWSFRQVPKPVFGSPSALVTDILHIYLASAVWAAG